MNRVTCPKIGEGITPETPDRGLFTYFSTSLLMVALLASAPGCKNEEVRHDHSTEHPSGHDHHEEGHGHGDVPMVSMTLWSDRFELFAEHPAGVVGHTMSFLIHLTTLDDFRALEQGSLTLELEGPAPLRGETSTVLRPGIFQIQVTPKAPGSYHGQLRIAGEAGGVIKNIEVQVFDDENKAAQSVSDHEEQGLIVFLKEQQWGVPFETAFAESGTVVSSVQVAGRVDTPPDGRAVVGASVTGRLVVPSGGLVRPGTTVHKGQLLAALMPAPSSPEAAALSGLAVVEAKARASAARTALQRAKRLFRNQAISKRELEDARREIRVARESVRAARRAVEFYSGASGGGDEATWQLTSPIDGTVVAVQATPGQTVSPGDTLFEIIDTRVLWIVARVPEQEAARLRTDRNASYRVAGLDGWTLIDITGKDPTASIVTIGRTVDPVSRTVDAIYALKTPEASLRVGGLVHVSVPAGEEFNGVVIPKSGLIDHEGRVVVYVQVDGEHFQERLVRIGPRAGDRVAIRDGLLAGERIVTKGAHLVRLADRSTSEQPHGHIH
jgi:cobalt-zinc-cadmium efflux system membrane fusion protein